MRLYFRHDSRRKHTGSASIQNGAVRERVWGFLLENRDTHTPQGQLIVDSIRQEDIATRVGLSLHEVIEAIDTLNREGRLQVEPQQVGRPNRYLLRDHDARTDAIAI
jgi:hypothetical protein